MRLEYVSPKLREVLFGYLHFVVAHCFVRHIEKLEKNVFEDLWYKLQILSNIFENFPILSNFVKIGKN